MKNICVVTIIVSLVYATLSYGEDFHGAPILQGGKTISSQKDRLEKSYATGYEAAVHSYKNMLKDQKDIKFWNRKTETYIEDHGTRPWHSITISKAGEKGTRIVIRQDSWTWIIGTLVLRFIGVFTVLCVLYLAMAVCGGIIVRSVKQVASTPK